jgi:hypothetical protein
MALARLFLIMSLCTLLPWGRSLPWGPRLRPDQLFALLYPRLSGRPELRLTLMGVYRAILSVEVYPRDCIGPFGRLTAGDPCWYCTVVITEGRGAIKTGEWCRTHWWTAVQLARQVLEGVGETPIWRTETRYTERRFRRCTAGESKIFFTAEGAEDRGDELHLQANRPLAS